MARGFSLDDKRVRGLVLLAGFTFFFIILAMLALTLRSGESEPQMQTRRLFPELNVNAVAKILVASSDGAFEVAKAPDGKWTVPSKSNFPAKLDTVKKTILSVATLDLIEAKTSRKEWHERLELSAPEEKGKGVSVTFQDEGGNTLAALVVGKVESYGGTKPGTLYVRRAGEDQAWLARGSLAVDRSVGNWIDTDVLKIRREAIARAEIAPEGAPPYALARESESKPDFAIVSIPQGKEPTSSSAVNGVGAALVGFGFDDVAPASTLDFAKASRATFSTFDGLVVALAIVKKDDEYWTTITASANPPVALAPPGSPAPVQGQPEGLNEDGATQAPATEGMPAAADQAAEAEAIRAAERAEAARKQADAINSRTAGWAFNVPKYKGDSLTTKLDSLLKDKAAQQPATPPPQQ